MTDLTPGELRLTHRSDGPVHTISLGGEMDLSNAQILADIVAGVCVLKPGTVSVDMSQLAFMDSAGLRATLQSMNTAQQAGASFSVASPQEAVRRVFEISGVAERLLASPPDEDPPESGAEVQVPAAEI
ncbi:MAG TPA: STAS domain-containing protein [Solirubrobacteraceae bacterium]|jgi:anti-anti-sigma factor|nr:STAS domain-containing protein [Solirubrobacteraceae bacterium]